MFSNAKCNAKFNYIREYRNYYIEGDLSKKRNRNFDCSDDLVSGTQARGATLILGSHWFQLISNFTGTDGASIKVDSGVKILLGVIELLIVCFSAVSFEQLITNSQLFFLTLPSYCLSFKTNMFLYSITSHIISHQFYINRVSSFF